MDAIGACSGCNGSCCCHYIVPITGYDAFLIATTQRVSMEEFVVYLPEPEPTPSGFVLDASERTYSLALSKQAVNDGRSPCTFLLRFAGGSGRCGIYDHRPLVCQTYPATLHNGSVDIRDDVICPAGSWNVAALNLPQWRDRLLRMDLELAIYALVVSRWNTMVRSRTNSASWSALQYFAFLMNGYHRIERLRLELSGGDAHRLARTWRSPSDSDAATTDPPLSRATFMAALEELLFDGPHERATAVNGPASSAQTGSRATARRQAEEQTA